MKKRIEERIEEIRLDGYEFKFSYYFSKAWEVFTVHTGQMIAFTFLLLFGLGIVSLIPFVGSIVRLLFQTPLFMGYSYVTYRIYNNKPIEFGNFFDGIKDFGKIFVINLIQGVFLFVSLIPVIIFLVYKITNDFNFTSFNNPNYFFELYTLQTWIQIIAISILLMLPSFYLSICFQFSTFFVVFAGTDYGTAIKWSMMLANKNIFSLILFNFTLGLIVVVSLLPIGLGLFISIPFALIIRYVLFHEILDFGHISHERRDEVQDYLNEQEQLDPSGKMSEDY